jgi:hypothetical protein
MKKETNYGIQAIIILITAFTLVAMLQDPFCK